MPSLEIFGNCASAVIATNGYNGGSSTADAPSVNTTETWTMGTGSGSFPAASNSGSPTTYFYIRDPADSTNEIVQVTNVSGTTFSVTRGISGSTATHAAGATWVQVVSQNTLQNFKQAPAASTTAVTVSNANQTTNETVVINYTPLAADLLAGTTWEIVSFGPLSWGGGSSRAVFQWTIYWGGSGSPGSTFTSTGSTALCTIKSGANTPAVANTTLVSGATYDYNGSITLISGQGTSSPVLTANANLFWINATTLTTAGVSATTTNSGSGGTTTANSITGTTIAGPIIVTFKWVTAATAYSMVATAPLCFRES